MKQHRAELGNECEHYTLLRRLQSKAVVKSSQAITVRDTSNAFPV